MEKRYRKDLTLSKTTLQAIKGVILLSGRAGFPDIDHDSHAVDLAVCEFYEQLKYHVELGLTHPFLTRDRWQQNDIKR